MLLEDFLKDPSRFVRGNALLACNSGALIIETGFLSGIPLKELLQTVTLRFTIHTHTYLYIYIHTLSLSVCLSIHLCIYLSIYLSIYL